MSAATLPLYQARGKTRDRMVKAFLKRIKIIYNNAKTKLEYLREKHLNQTQTILELFGEIIVFSQEFGITNYIALSNAEHLKVHQMY